MNFIILQTYMLGPLIKLTIRSIHQSLLNEDIRTIRSGGHIMIKAKQELHELQKHMNDASFFLAGGIRDPENLSEWIKEAQKISFCLEDQIAMYAIPGARELELFAMKLHIGMARIRELITKVEEFKASMPTDMKTLTRPDNMAQLTSITPFLRSSMPNEMLLGVDIAMNDVKELLGSDHSVIFITGEQGSGKTTLMRAVYEACTKKNDFDLLSWVDVEKPRGLADLMRNVLKGLHSSGSNMGDYDAIGEFELMKKVHDTFSDKHYLLVLDDVQDPSILYNIKHVLKGYKGKIICISGNTSVEDSESVTYEVPSLGDDDAWKLLLHVASQYFDHVTEKDVDLQSSFSIYSRILGKMIILAPTEYTEELKQVQEKMKMLLWICSGNPRKIWTLGTQLKDIDLLNENMQNIYERIDDMMMGTDPPLLLENAHLPPGLRLCFLYCMAFPEISEVPQNSGIPKRKLIRLWTAEGFVHKTPYETREQVAEGLLQQLIDRKLLVVKKYSFNGEVLKCSVNAHVRHLALRMCNLQKFCRFVPGDEHEPLQPNRRIGFSRKLSRIFSKKRALRERYRMVAVHGEVKEISKTLVKDIRLRSFLYFGTRRMHPPKIDKLTFGRTYMLLRSLELQGIQMDRLPDSIDYLVCLRYLGLRNTQLESLPPSLQRLKFLMCLDIRDTNIVEVEDVSAFTKMRYLHLANSFRSQFVQIGAGLQSLTSLRTLSGAAYRVANGEQLPGPSFEEELVNLKLLRKLSIKNVKGASSAELCHALNELEFLESLTLTCEPEEFLDISSLRKKRNLHRLKLGGNMGGLSDRISMMQSIIYLYLWNSNLTDDTLQSLQHLPNLALLSLYNASIGTMLSCDNNCYTKLKKLSIISLGSLNICEIGKGAMRCLEELVFAVCGNLSSPPKELSQLPSLREVQFAQMPEEFCEAIMAINSGRAADLEPVKVLKIPLPLHYWRVEEN